MDASVTIKMTPQEFDTVRTAMQEYAKACHEVANEPTADPPLRRQARESEAQVRLLLKRLGFGD